MESHLMILSSVDLLCGIITIIVQVVILVYHSGPHNPIDLNEYEVRAWFGLVIIIVGLATFKCIRLHHRSEVEPISPGQRFWTIIVVLLSLVAVSFAIVAEVLSGKILTELNQYKDCLSAVIPHTCTNVIVYNALIIFCGTIILLNNLMKIVIVLRVFCRRDGYVQLI